MPKNEINSEDSIAVYVRRSTRDQDDEHQLDDIKSWLDFQDLSISEVDLYAEQASGASSDREKFQALIDEVSSDQLDAVVVWEISRIARNGLLAQEFFEACEGHDVTIYVTHGSVRMVEPDGHGRLVADIVAAVAAEERRRLIERTKSGQRRARKQGKWVGQPPKGFTTDSGYLKPNLNPEYDEGETGYFDMVESIEDIQNGKSYRQAAKDTPNVTRATLSSIDQDEERSKWYSAGQPSDEKVADALEDVDGAEAE